MIGGIFLSTKVGGFTKNGVVQCVKLVEEPAKINTNAFSGTYSGSTVILNNGMEISLVGRDFISGDRLYFVYDENYSTVIFDLLVESNGIVTLDLAAGDQEFTKTDNIYFTRIVLETDPMTGSVPSEIIFSSTGSTIHYSYEVQISSSRFGFASDSMYVLTPAARLKNPTVRMGKDGTLKCKELVEEPAIDLTSTFGGVISGGGINLDNGYRLQFKSGSSWSSAVNKTTFPSNMYGLNITIQNSDYSSYAIWFSRSSSSVNRFTASFNNNSYEDRAPIIWADKSPIKMYFNQLSIFESSSGGYDRSYFPLNQTYLAMYNKNNELIFYYTFTGYDMDTIYGSWETPGSVPYSDRFKTPTVRVFKDGTVKCAEVQEATLRSKLNEFSGSSTLPPSSGVVTCTNGLKISIGAYSFPGSSGDAYTFVFRDENYRDFLKIIGKGASTTITSALDTSNASIWNQLSDITISEIKLDYLSTTTMPSSLVITWKDKSYTYSLYPSSTNPYSKLYRPSSSQVVLSVLDRVSFTWTS